MDAALRRRSNPPDIFEVRVSILVLMDAALRHCGIFIHLVILICFNPCFDGCRPATRRIAIETMYLLGFQSLF